MSKFLINFRERSDNRGKIKDLTTLYIRNSNNYSTGVITA